MEPLNTKSNQTSSIMESEQGTISNGDSRIHSPTAVNKVEQLTSGKSLSSSSFSSSPDSPLDDPFQEDGNEPDKSTPSTTALPKFGEDAQLSSGYNQDNMPTTESPPSQVMERPDNSPYRIPSSVFATSKSTAPVEWSTASNESLFSIHMGNMSFTNDNIFFRSGELGTLGEPSTSGQMFNYSANQSSGTDSKPTESAKSRELGAAVEIMKEALKENEENQNNKKISIDKGHISHSSHGSANSTTSFAFPILAGELEKGTSAKIGGSVKVVREKPLSRPQLQSQQQPPQAEPKTPAANLDVAQTSWFSCLPCYRPRS